MKNNQDFNVPPNFDWIAYRSRNRDLSFITSEKDAFKHWKTHGYRQNRPYTFEQTDDEKEINVTQMVSSDQIKSVNIRSAQNVDKYQNKINGVPEEFNWIAYKSLNKDLKHIKTYVDAVKHYLNHGHRQNRAYSYAWVDDTNMIPIIHKESDLNVVQAMEVNEVNYEQLNKKYGVPNDFDWCVYKSCNSDLNGIKTYFDAIRHYLEHGHRENRKYKNDVSTSVVTISSQQPIPQPIPQSIPQPIPLPPPQPIPQPIPQSIPQSSNNVHDDHDLSNMEKEIPKDFDWVTYKSINPDLQHIKGHSDAIRHYLDHGKREGRQYKTTIVGRLLDVAPMEKVTADYDWVTYRPISVSHETTQKQPSAINLPHDFDWKAYKLQNPDLLFINSYQDAVRHFKEHGYRENRPYVLPVLSSIQRCSNRSNDQIPADFNWIYYKSAHVDLKNLINNEQDAIKHYIEHGRKENRVYKPQLDQNLSEQHQNQEQERESHRLAKIKQEQERLKQEEVKCELLKQETSRHHEHSKHGQTRIVQPKITPPKQSVELNQFKKKPSIIKGTKKRQITQKPNIVSTPTPSSGTIPNIIHFIYGFIEQKCEFELYKYIAIISAYHVNKPDKIYFYYKYEPYGPYWEKIKPYLTMVQIEPPDQVFGKPVRRFEHKADIVRLNVLNEKGGIYLDIDTICLRPLNGLLKYDFVMGVQGENYGLCNAIMMAKPGTDFGKQWFRSYESYNTQWDLHSVKIPYNLSAIYPITILRNDALFYPLWDPFCDLMITNTVNFDCCHKIFQNSYCVHLWEKWTGRELQKISEQNLYDHHSLYNLMCRKFFRNNITLIMMINMKIHANEAIKAIGTFYKTMTREDVSEFIVYDMGHDDAKLMEYLDNLPNINQKFKVIHLPKTSTIQNIKRESINKINDGIICFMDQPIRLSSEKLFDFVVDYLYDESIGMIGLTGGYLSNSSKLDPHQNLSCEKNTTVDYLVGCQFFRSDLKFYNIQIDIDDPLYDLDFSSQIRDLGKILLLLSCKDLINNHMDDSLNHIPKNLWSTFMKKWGHLGFINQ